MKIQIYYDIKDEKLINSWKTIVERNNYLPQSTYEWCSTWWKYFSDEKKELHIITVIDNEKIVGIAPMFIEKKIFNKQMKFIGVGLTDFHELLIEKSKYERVFKKIMDYFCLFNGWDIVLFDQINNELSDYNYLLKNTIKNKYVVECPIIDISKTNWDDYKKNIVSKNHRKMVNRRLRNYDDSDLTFSEINKNEIRKELISEILETHIERWNTQNSDSKFVNPVFREFMSEVFYQMIKDGLAVCYVIKDGEELVSYRLGFITDNTFYDWNTSFNHKYAHFSPGLLITALVIEYLIDNKIEHFHFMRGGYDYKKRWMMKGAEHISKNYLFILSKPNIKGRILEKYYLVWRDQIKDKFNSILQNRYFRRLVGLK